MRFIGTPRAHAAPRPGRPATGWREEDHRKALNPLALPSERKPSRIGFVAQDDLRFGKQVPGLERNHAQVDTAFAILGGDLRSPGQGPCDVLQARVSFQQAPIQQVENA